MPDQTAADTREHLRSLALSLATGSALVEPSAFDAAIDAHRAAVLREAADAVFALEYDVMVGEEGDENLGSMREAWDVGTIHATQLLRRMADETQPAETDAWQREWDSRPNGADVSDLIEIVPVVPCSGTLHGEHPAHGWEPQPGTAPVHCPGQRQPAAGARQDGAQPT